MITRRGFLALGAAGAAAMVLDPERLLWVPGARTFYLPPEKRVVGAAIGDVEALMASIGGPLVVGMHPRRAGLTSVYTTPDPSSALRLLTDQEYALLVDRGRRMLAHRRGLVLPSTDEIARGWRA